MRLVLSQGEMTAQANDGMKEELGSSEQPIRKKGDGYVKRWERRVLLK